MVSLSYIRLQNAIRMLYFDFLKPLGHVRTMFDMLLTSKIIFLGIFSEDIFSKLVKMYDLWAYLMIFCPTQRIYACFDLLDANFG